MATRSKSKSSSRALVTQLVIAGIVLLGAAIVVKTNLDNRSKAAFNPTQACVNACNQTYNGGAVIDRAACALDCRDVVAETMSCSNFCRQNVRTGAAGMQVCKNRCNQWLKDPCVGDGAVCKYAVGQNNSIAKSQCKTACNTVKEEDATCAEAMTNQALSAVHDQALPLVQQNCKKYFE